MSNSPTGSFLTFATLLTFTHTNRCLPENWGRVFLVVCDTSLDWTRFLLFIMSLTAFQQRSVRSVRFQIDYRKAKGA